MATVIWTESAQAEKREFYRQGFLEFGRTIANKTNQKIEAIENDLAKHPKVGYLEPLLKSAAIQYRSKHIIKDIN